jgi:hypothetical protein
LWLRNSRISVLVVGVTPVASSPVHLLLLRRLELVSGNAGALLFSQCNMAWRSFYRLGVQGFRFLFLLFFYCQVWLQQ